MAGPQKENGYTPLAHEILDEICRFKFNGAQFRIIIKVWRLTYGFNRKDHDLSLTLLHEATGISERTIKKEVASLIKSNVLIVTKEATNVEARRLAFNKNYEEWIIQKSGESMDEQLKLFILEGSETSPRDESFEGSDTSPPEGGNTSPQSNENPYFEGSNTSPKRTKRSLKISFKEIGDVFNRFWSIYPRRVSRAAAEKAWSKLSKESGFDPERIIAYTSNYADTCKLLETETKFIPHPSTYLNQKRYEDYPTVDPEGLAKPKNNKLSNNLDFLMQQMEGEDGSKRGQLTTGEGIGSLPE